MEKKEVGKKAPLRGLAGSDPLGVCELKTL